MRTCRGVGGSFCKVDKALIQLSFFPPIANVIVYFLRIYRYSRTVRSERLNGPFFLFSPLLYVASIGERWRSPTLTLCAPRQKNSSHWAFISLIRPCGCSTAIGAHRYVF